MLRHVLTACLAFALLTRAQAEQAAKSGIELLKAIEDGFVQLFERVAPSVVVIEAIKSGAGDEDQSEAKAFEFFFKHGDEARRQAPSKEKADEDAAPWRLPLTQKRSEGSGFIIRADGFIITNQHVIADAEKLNVRLKDGRTFPAKVIGTDDRTDIAVIRIDAKDLPVGEFGDSEKLRVGQLVCAIGAPFNQDYSFTAGWVSGKGRTNLLGPGSPSILYEDYIQTDAFINPGNSGGPLFDVEGKVVGMNTLINGIGRGLAFAIPAAMLEEVSAQLIERGRVQRPWLGIRIETLGRHNALAGIDRGVVVYTIEADAPAYKSDLRAADVITEVDGAPVATDRELQKEILRKKIGQTIQLTVWRRGATLKIPIATAELPGELTRVANVQPPGPVAASAEALGLQLRDAEKAAGALVSALVPDSAAARAEIEAGDLITAVEAKPVGSAEACAQAIAAGARERGVNGVLLNIERKGRRTFAVLKEVR